jgi:ketosteroid isomerase-like protein
VCGAAGGPTLAKTVVLVGVAGTLLLPGPVLRLPASAGGAPDPGLRSLVVAERNFARTSVQNGVREAFLAFLAEDAVLFRPGPVPGREWIASRPPVAGRLSWEPLYADLSRDGAFGYTTGPWQFLPSDGEPSYGHYVSVWRKDANGEWRVAADIGITHPRSAPAGDLRFPEPARSRPNVVQTGSRATHGIEALRAADGEFVASAAREGAQKACLVYGAESLRLYRDGTPPVVGRDPACRALAERREQTDSHVEGQAISKSGELGLVYGTLEFGSAGEGLPTRRGSFLRIWKQGKEGSWQLVLDVAIPHPTPTDP